MNEPRKFLTIYPEKNAFGCCVLDEFGKVYAYNIMISDDLRALLLSMENIIRVHNIKMVFSTKDDVIDERKDKTFKTNMLLTIGKTMLPSYFSSDRDAKYTFLKAYSHLPANASAVDLKSILHGKWVLSRVQFYNGIEAFDRLKHLARTIGYLPVSPSRTQWDQYFEDFNKTNLELEF